jgi:hypothetical protein
LKHIVMILTVAVLVAGVLMGSAGWAFGAPEGGCAGNNNANNNLESHGVNKASPDLFANCGEELPPGQKVREPA